MSNHKIGGIIAGLRREKGCTQEELARAMAHGITDGTRPGGYATREEVALMAERAYSGRA